MRQGMASLNKYVVANWKDPKSGFHFEAGFYGGEFGVFILDEDNDKVIFDRKFNIKRRRFIKDKDSSEKG